MNTVLIIFGIILVLLGTVGIIAAFYYNQFQMANIRVREAENSIELLLQKKIEVLSRVGTTVKDIEQDLENEEVFVTFIKIKNKKLSYFELDQELRKAKKDLQEFFVNHKDLQEKEEILKIYEEFIDTENDLNAAKKYYNFHTTRANHLLKKFPSNIIGKFIKQKSKELYSEEVEEMFEILKEKNSNTKRR